MLVSHRDTMRTVAGDHNDAHLLEDLDHMAVTLRTVEGRLGVNFDDTIQYLAASSRVLATVHTRRTPCTPESGLYP